MTMKIFYNKQIENTDINLVQCGFEKCENGHAFGPYIRDHHLLHYIMSGKGSYTINNKQYSLSEGQLFYIPPHVVTVYKADITEPWTYMWVGLNGLRAESFLSAAGLNENNPCIWVDGKESVENAFNTLIQDVECGASSLHTTGSLYHVIAALSKGSSPITHTTDRQKYVAAAITFIDAYIYQRITVAHLAGHIGLDRSYFCNIFKKELGISPREYILTAKMQKAAAYLKYTNYSIKHIALSVGYEDQLLFSRMFRTKMGLSPSSFRHQ